MTLIGFRRNVYLEWLEEAAAQFCLGVQSPEVRAHLDGLLAPTVQSDVNRRQTIDILMNVWGPGDGEESRLRQRAMDLFQSTTSRDQHVVLHYGLTLCAYSFFREGVRAIGQHLRYGGTVQTADVRTRMQASVGNLGAVYDAVKRITFSLRNWGLLVEAGKRNHYRAREPRLAPETREMASWLLAAALTAHPADELPFADLVGLPELFAFQIEVSPEDLGRSDLCEVHRAGGGWEMVVLRE